MSDDHSAVDGWFREEEGPVGAPPDARGNEPAWQGEWAVHQRPDETPTQQFKLPQIPPPPPPATYQRPEQFVARYPAYEPHEHDRRAAGRVRRPVLLGSAVVGGVAAMALVGYLTMSHGGGTLLNTADHHTAGAGSASPSPTGFQPTSQDPAVAAAQLASVFLGAWQSGDLQKAANYTDDPTAALAALTAYKTQLNLSGLTLSPRPATVASASASPGTASASASATATGASPGTAATAATVPFSVASTVALANQTTTTASWNYTSSLSAYKQTDGWSVRWDPSILAPGLTASEQLSVVAVHPGVGKVVDAAGSTLSGSSETALRTIAGVLSTKAPTGTGTPGIAVVFTDSSGNAVANSSTTVKKPVDASVLKTTFDPRVQGLAEAAAAKFPRSSMVVLQASTGKILAIANSAGSGDTALNGTLAPGSTFKTVTTTALLNDGFVTLYQPVGCPLTVTVQGVVYHNSTDTGGKEESLPPGTPFITDFAQSCNNAFTPFYAQLGGGRLASAASTYYGLDHSWDIGLGPADYFNIPGGSSGAELAQETFGQGKIVASPLAMASVAATIGAGSFHQPYLVDGVAKVSASALPSGTDSALKQAMHAVATYGTAAGVFNAVGHTVYAKTGTADADANKDGKPNSWMIVYDPSQDVAIGCVVVDSGFGASFAGPEASYVLAHL